MNLGEQIYKYRTAKNMSQGDLADALEVSRQSVSKWENNTAVPELDKLIRLAEVFEVSLDELVGRTDAKQESSAPSTGTSINITLDTKTLNIRKLIGSILIGIAVLVAGLGLLIPDFATEAGFYFALVLATIGVACIWPLNHFSNIFIFVLDTILSLMLAGVSPHSAAITAVPFLTVFIIQCLRWLKTLPDDSEQEDKT